MPFITIESGLMPKEQKNELIERITQIASEITQIPREFFFVSIKELPDENIGIGGISIDKIKANHR
ncbi:MAG: tautomerase family protein [Firmicutes bacterium]|nr:tautomerase family protein [Bacillota bacterium]